MGTVPENLQEPLKRVRHSLDLREREGSGVLVSETHRPGSFHDIPNPTSAHSLTDNTFGWFSYAGTGFGC